eukprot:GILJ01009402.1.p1 GENE.GILJ01009402.1~~GILJ01009402.1.p1  ORF type:complete len:942 (+),score=162.96 GILJ01009402.1:294-2828(+)
MMTFLTVGHSFVHAFHHLRPTRVGCFFVKGSAEGSDVKLEQLHDVGVLAEITKIDATPYGYELKVVGKSRVKLKRDVILDVSNMAANDGSGSNGSSSSASFLSGVVEILRDESFSPVDEEVGAYTREIVAGLREISQGQYWFKDQITDFLPMVDRYRPNQIADVSASFSMSDSLTLQNILEAVNIKERLRLALQMVRREVTTSKIQDDIRRKYEKNIEQLHQEMLLTAQKKTIDKELHSLRKTPEDDREATVKKFKDKMLDKKLSEAVEKVFQDELAKLGSLEPRMSEYHVVINYLDWLTSLPWGVLTNDRLDVTYAQTVLEEDHYGIKDVKERILEFIAVASLKQEVSGKILCLVGPPGVGKTSIGKSISRAIDRKFYRFSVGGMFDTAEIKGHRRTYVGALPGKLIHGVKSTQCQNPVILIDEIDKMGSQSRNGDPSAALLEALDPEQNKDFTDHYLDLPFDLSKVLFICTANSLDSIPTPLLDRMEIIRMSGYVTEEKVAIAEKYLIPRIRSESGVPLAQSQIETEAILALIDAYSRENGVRNLQKSLEKVFRKCAYRIASGNTEVPAITKENLASFLGNPVYAPQKLYDPMPVGVSAGLAWSEQGGAVMFVESICDHTSKQPGLRVTGQLGEVMKESTDIAVSYARSMLDTYFPSNKFFKSANIHLHCPEGATPKDGPSAGCAMVSSLLSLALNKPIRNEVAMTGEITLNGKVCAIGGLREKIIAAKREGYSHIVVPALNKKDWDELPDFIRNGVNVHFVTVYSEIYRIIFGEELPRPKQVTGVLDTDSDVNQVKSTGKRGKKTSAVSEVEVTSTAPEVPVSIPLSRQVSPASAEDHPSV